MSMPSLRKIRASLKPDLHMNKSLIVFGWVVFLITASVLAAEKASEQRLDEVAERGSHVMPFDLEKTTHIFSKTDTGGIQEWFEAQLSDHARHAVPGHSHDFSHHHH